MRLQIIQSISLNNSNIENIISFMSVYYYNLILIKEKAHNLILRNIVRHYIDGDYNIIKNAIKLSSTSEKS